MAREPRDYGPLKEIGPVRPLEQQVIKSGLPGAGDAINFVKANVQARGEAEKASPEKGGFAPITRPANEADREEEIEEEQER